MTIHREGKVHQQTYARGTPKTKLKLLDNSNAHGTILRWKGIRTSSRETRYQLDIIENRLREARATGTRA